MEEKKDAETLKEDLGMLFLKIFDSDQLKKNSEINKVINKSILEGKNLREILADLNIDPEELGITEFVDMDLSKVTDKNFLKNQMNLESINIKDFEDFQKIGTYLTKKIMLEGALPKDALNISDDIMETFYAQGYALYNGGKYEEAEIIFKLINMLDPIEDKYIFSLAAAQHKGKKYDKAVLNYMMSATLNLDNALALYHASDCCLKMSDPVSALMFIELVKNIYSDKIEWKHLIEKVSLMEKIINKKLSSLSEDQIPPVKDIIPTTGPIAMLIEKARIKYGI